MSAGYVTHGMAYRMQEFSVGMFYSTISCIAVSLHISVGFCVAYPYLVGNAKAWGRGISNRYRFPRLFILNNI